MCWFRTIPTFWREMRYGICQFDFRSVSSSLPSALNAYNASIHNPRVIGEEPKWDFLIESRQESEVNAHRPPLTLERI